MLKIRNTFLFITLLFLQACYEPVSKQEAQKIALNAACPYIEKFGEVCNELYPDDYQEDEFGIKAFTFFIQKEPEYTIVVLVKKNGTYEISIWDER